MIVQKILLRLTTSSLIILIICQIMGRLGNLHWILDLFSHWQGQYVVASLLLSLLYALSRRIVGFILCIVLSIWSVIPLYASWNYQMAEKADIYSINALYTNPSPESIRDDIRKRSPNFITVVELPPTLSQLLVEMGYTAIIDHADSYRSLGIFVKKELAPEVSQEFIVNIRTFPIGHIVYRDTHIVLIHPFPPLSEELASEQREVFAHTRGLINTYMKNDESFIVLGDFNSTIFSPVFQTYFSDFSSPLLYSWHRGKIYQLPIDHVITDQKIGVTIVPQKTSDHSALVVDVRNW